MFLEEPIIWKLEARSFPPMGSALMRGPGALAPEEFSFSFAFDLTGLLTTNEDRWFHGLGNGPSFCEQLTALSF